jgi:hypothetical protein
MMTHHSLSGPVWKADSTVSCYLPTAGSKRKAWPTGYWIRKAVWYSRRSLAAFVPEAGSERAAGWWLAFGRE